MYEFKMPALGAEMTEGTLLEWRVKEGDQIKRHDVMAVIDTDKAAIEAEAFHGGTVEQLLIKEGEKIAVGTVLATIRDGERELAEPRQLKVSPRAKRLAKERGVDLTKVEGTGPGGSIVAADIKEKGPSRAVTMQQVIAGAMAKSKREIPHYYLSYDIDLTQALKWLKTYNAQHSVAERLLFAPLLIKAVALALKKYPNFNGHFQEKVFQPSEEIHVGFAIALRGGGLIAPALLQADTLSLAETMEQLTDLATRVRGGMLRGRELSSPTISITSLGEFGVDSVFGIIYPPQVALVGFGKIQADQTITATLAADHRVTNGLSGSHFLTTIAELLQEPENL
jgi:pyruvate dehydrogenase E2 component (dihydrolipoyllysine-residue acetyltransferase)